MVLAWNGHAKPKISFEHEAPPPPSSLPHLPLGMPEPALSSHLWSHMLSNMAAPSLLERAENKLKLTHEMCQPSLSLLPTD